MTSPTPLRDDEDELQSILWFGLGEVSAIFMSNPKPGTQQIMPEDQLSKVGSKQYDAIKKLIEATVNEAIGEDDTRPLIETYRGEPVTADFTRNKLRAEQRDRLKQSMKGAE